MSYWHASAPPSSITDHKVYLPTPNNPPTSSSVPPHTSVSTGGGGLTGEQYGNGAPYRSTALEPSAPPPLPAALANHATPHNHHHQVPHLPNSIRARKPERPKLLIEQSFSPPGISAGTVEDESNTGGGGDNGTTPATAADSENGQTGAHLDPSAIAGTGADIGANLVNASANMNKSTSPSVSSGVESSNIATMSGEPNSNTTSGVGSSERETGNSGASIYTSLNGLALPGAAITTPQSGARTSAVDSSSRPAPSSVATARRSSSSRGSIPELPAAAPVDPNVVTGQLATVSTSGPASSASMTPKTSSVSAAASSATKQQPTPTSPTRLESGVPDMLNSGTAVGHTSYSLSTSPHAGVFGTGTGTGESGQKNPEADIFPPTPISAQSSTATAVSNVPSSTPSAFLQSRTLQLQQQFQYQQQLMQHHGAQWRQHAASLVNGPQSSQVHMATRQQQALANMSLQPPLPSHPGDAPGASYATTPFPSQQPAPPPFPKYQNAPSMALQSTPGGSQVYPPQAHATWAHGAPGQPYQQPSPTDMRPPTMNVNMGMPAPMAPSASQFNSGGDQYKHSSALQSSAGYTTMPPSSQQVWQHQQPQPVQRPGWQSQPGDSYPSAGVGYGDAHRGTLGPYVPPPPLRYGAYRQPPMPQQSQSGFGYYPPQPQSQRGFDDGPPPPYEARPENPGNPNILAPLPGQSTQNAQQQSMQSSSSFGPSGFTATATSSTPAGQTRAPRSPQLGRRTPFFMRPPTPEREIPGQPKIERFHPISENSKVGGELKYVGFEIHEAYALSAVPITHHYKFAADRGAKGAAARAANSVTATGSNGNGATANNKKRKAPSSSRRSGRRTTNARKPMMLDDTDEDAPGSSRGVSANNGTTTPKPLRPRRKASAKIFNASLAQPEEDEDDEYFSDEDEPEKEDSDDDYIDDAPIRPVKKRGRRAAASDNEDDNTEGYAAGNIHRDTDSTLSSVPSSPSRTKSGRTAKPSRSPNSRRELPPAPSGRSNRK